MADTKITALTAISTVDPAVDVLPIVDVSDTTMAASGTTKKITSNQILGAGGTATLASATITGDLTVATSVLKVDSANTRVGINTTTINGGPFNVKISSAIDAKFVVQDGFTTGNVRLAAVDNAYSNYKIMDYSALSHAWYNSGSTAMTLNSTGLGVGVSPSAGRLHIKGGASQSPLVLDTLGYNQIVLQLNGANRGQIYADATNCFALVDSTGSNSRLLVTDSGNVGVGVTPINKLQVAASALAAVPAAGASGHMFAIGSTPYGIAAGALTSGNSYIQATRWDGTATNYDLLLQPNGGNLLVGTTGAIGGKLGIQAQGGNGVAYLLRDSSATAGKYRIFAIDSTNNGLFYDQDNVGMYMADGGTSWVATSDETKKDIIEPISNAVSKIGSLRSVIGKFKTDKEGTRRSFLIAQDVQSVLPEAIHNKDGELGLSYTDVIPLLVAAIKELTARVEALEA